MTVVVLSAVSRGPLMGRDASNGSASEIEAGRSPGVLRHLNWREQHKFQRCTVDWSGSQENVRGCACTHFSDCICFSPPVRSARESETVRPILRSDNARDTQIFGSRG